MDQKVMFSSFVDAEMHISHKMQTSFEKLRLIFASNIPTYCFTWKFNKHKNTVV